MLSIRKKIRLILRLVLGVLITIGGWSLFLVSLDIITYPLYSIVALVIMGSGVVAMLSGMLGYGPILLWEVYQDYKEFMRVKLE